MSADNGPDDELPPLLAELDQIGRTLRSAGDRLAAISREEAERQRLADTAPITAEYVRRVQEARGMRKDVLPNDLLYDPVWEMMLDLAAARLEGKQVAVSSLCVVSQVPATTALNWIRILSKRGSFLRSADPSDGRRVYISLADDLFDRVCACLKEERRTALRGL